MTIMEFMMKRKEDLIDFEAVFALFTISHCADMMFDEIAEDDLPDSSIRDEYRAVRSSIHALTKSIEQYRDDKMDTFIADCED